MSEYLASRSSFYSTCESTDIWRYPAEKLCTFMSPNSKSKKRSVLMAAKQFSHVKLAVALPFRIGHVFDWIATLAFFAPSHVAFTLRPMQTWSGCGVSGREEYEILPSLTTSVYRAMLVRIVRVFPETSTETARRRST